MFADTSINEGDIIEVTDAGDGEYAVYLAKQDNPASTGHLTLISTRDSSGTDAATLSSTVQFNDGNVTLGNVSNLSRPMEVLVEVTTVFDGDTTITIGDDADPDSGELFPCKHCAFKGCTWLWRWMCQRMSPYRAS